MSFYGQSSERQTRSSGDSGRSGVVEYVPEPVYFHERGGSALKHAFPVTAQCVVQWATEYLAYPVCDRSLVRRGSLTGSVEAREAFVGSLFQWARELGRSCPPGTARLGLVLHLSRESGPLLDTWDDGMPRRMLLMPDEFRLLQECWAHHNLPQDLFYPSSQQRSVIEPISAYGGVVLAKREYSPLEWTRRSAEVIAALKVAPEEERTAHFLDALRRFERALLLRRLELAEPGKEPNPEALRELDLLLGDLQVIRARALGSEERDLHQMKRRAERAHRRSRK